MKETTVDVIINSVEPSWAWNIKYKSNGRESSMNNFNLYTQLTLWQTFFDAQLSKDTLMNIDCQLEEEFGIVDWDFTDPDDFGRISFSSEHCALKWKIMYG